MALSSNTIWEVRTTGSDTLNGGAFDPSQTAGMFTDLTVTSGGDARTASPVVKSASYNFVAGDVSAWIYIASGTNWTPGWYQIASVASNEATLSAAIGAAVLAGLKVPSGLSTAAGVATVQTPTNGTWTIDYSQQAAAQFAYTDLASVGTGLTISSAAKPFAKQQVGNSLVVTGGTNLNTGRYVIASVAAGVATVVGPTNITTGAGINGTGGQGGALATVAQPHTIAVSGNSVWVQSGTYSITTTVTPAGTTLTAGYQTLRTDQNDTTGTGAFTNCPSLVVNNAAIAGFTISNTSAVIRNFVVDAGVGATKGTTGVLGNIQVQLIRVKVNGAWSGVGIDLTSGPSAVSRCFVTGMTGGTAAYRFSATGVGAVDCVASSNACPGFSITVRGALIRCIAASNSGASSDGILIGGGGVVIDSCVCYSNGRDGIRDTNANPLGTKKNCILVSNSGYGINYTALTNPDAGDVDYNFYYSNTSGTVNAFNTPPHSTILTGDPFTNAGSQDFSLNNTAGAGAAVRAAGYPGTYSGIATTGYKDGGAVQHRDSPASIINAPITQYLTEEIYY